jgi:hypothetical protein
MAFTDRYIKLPIELFDKKLAETTGDFNSSSFQGYMMINPFEIRSYRPCYSEDGASTLEETIVDFKSGESVVVLLDIKDFERKLNIVVE